MNETGNVGCLGAGHFLANAVEVQGRPADPQWPLHGGQTADEEFHGAQEAEDDGAAWRCWQKLRRFQAVFIPGNPEMAIVELR